MGRASSTAASARRDSPGGRDAIVPPPVDDMVRLLTPERIVFAYPLAGPFRRASAYLIDLGILILAIMAGFLGSLSLGAGGASGMGLGLVFFFVISWGYGAFFEGMFNGQTPGKRALGLRVVSEQGVPITPAQAILRNLVGVVDGMVPFGFLVGLSSMILSPRFQRLGDLAAGTMVIAQERRPRLGLPRFRDPTVLAIVERLPARIALGSELSLALSDYVSRRHRFGAGLREEIGEPLAGRLRDRFGLPAGIPADVVLCAVYHRVFLGD